MNKIIMCITLVVCALLTNGQQKANYKLAERYKKHEIVGVSGNSMAIYPEFINDSDRFWYSFSDSNGKRYYYVDPAKKLKRLLFDNDELVAQISKETRKAYNSKDLSLQSIEFDKKERSFTFEFDGAKYRYTVKTGKVEKIDSLQPWSGRESWMKYSPDSLYILYCKNHNLYVMGNKDKGQDSTEVQLTFDAEKNFTFAKEMDDSDGEVETVAEWFKDSKKIYAVREDARKVKDLYLVNSLSQPRPTLKTYKYDMPGDKEISQSELLVIDVETKKITKFNIDRWQDQYFEVLYVSKDSERIYFERTNRAYNEKELCVINVLTGEVKVLIHEVDKPFMDFKMVSISFLNDGKDIVYRSERSGWGHYYLYDGEGNLKNEITSGDWVAGPICEIDTVGRALYFYALGKDENIDPYYYTLCRASLDKPNSVEQLTFDNVTHAVDWSKTFNYFIDTYQRVDLEPHVVLRNRHGKKIMDLEKADISRIKEMGWKAPERFKVKAADGVTDLYGVMWKPFDFDSTKHYPIISSVYPGPFYEYVPTQFDFIHGRNTQLAQLGLIVIAVGHRGGSPMRGKYYHTYGFGNLRDYPLADDKYAIEQLADRYPYIDATRVGIFGHSGGGFMATAAICTYPDFYKAAVSAAGNHDNYIYNKWFTETHNGATEEKKVVKDSVNGDRTEYTYKFRVNTNINLAKNYKKGLLLVTGDMDDNVHPAHTYRMIDALIKAGKNFDMLVLPGQDHGFSGAAELFFERKLWAHFAKYLLGDSSADYKSSIEN
ncbi:S9 family peptidase [Butyricimonas virosa]|uniref:S9 family peptidase n=1 Tax=Butyricimonas virosa TaxID=544645 RepID=A0ABX7H8K9_9BACT|nr:DPP IV N-terminal domain-containing protein [Butyricimonas virosa]MCI7292447.1 DPP IV N-terminal domain-containing protein [Butyricimonas virosa]MDY6220241.1 DPP IV N-terminal domain-containing protein [Butyricimonas virosa]QRO51176.1 S9 family peptidase [Butyricimonas virosa]UWO48088.1 DPP IV N-terminal domain-containing protein [Butyricimonas virosa]